MPSSQRQSQWLLLLDLAIAAIDTLPGGYTWSLGGGTALALRIDHRVSFDIELRGALEDSFVAVCRSVHHQDPVSHLEPLASKLGVPLDGAHQVLEWRYPAQHLFDGRGDL